MGRSGLLVLGAIFAVTSFACSDANDGLLSSRRLRRSSPPAEGTPGNHDSSDTEGENGTDVGNPNADTTPDAPSTPGTAAAEFAVTLANATPTSGLDEETELEFTVEPKNGFAGAVDVTVTGLPEGVTAAPAQVTVSGASATGKLVLDVAADAVVTEPGESAPLVVTARSGSIAATANANFKVAPKLTLTIPVNVDALRAANTKYRSEWGEAFGANPKALRTQVGNGVVVTVFNADSKQHIIHGASGFQHGNTNAPIQPNSFEMSGGSPRTRTLGVGTDANGYPHDGNNGSGASFRIKVAEAP